MTMLLEQTDRHVAAPSAPGGGPFLPWVISRHPATTRQERQFVSDLRARCDGKLEPPRRQDVTVVLNALRGGLTCAELVELAPGVRAGRLLAAYVELDDLRAGAAEAWAAIVAEPTVGSLERHGAAAALVPVLVERLWAAAAIGQGALADVAARYGRRVDEQRAAVWQIESAIASLVPTASDRRSMGQLLYDGSPDCLAARDDFVADRVGLLTSIRVAALLGARDDR